MRAWRCVLVLVLLWLGVGCGGRLPPPPPRQSKLGLSIHAFRIQNNGLRVVLIHDPKTSQIQVAMRYIARAEPDRHADLARAAILLQGPRDAVTGAFSALGRTPRVVAK